jgi:Putative endonuclease, protein of unknown function (DUF1780)
MAVTADQERGQTRLWLSQQRKPERDCAVMRAFLRALGVAYSAAEIVVPGAAPVDVQFREAQFHVRELRDHLCGRHGQEHAGVHQSRAYANGGTPDALTEGRQRAVLLAHVTAVLAPHAAWYGARCTGLDALVMVDECQRLLVPPAPMTGVAALPRQGWRSVSVWWPPAALVLYTADGAPAFLRDGTGQRRRHAEHDAWTHADARRA